MIGKLGKNKSRSFSAATNLKTQPLEKKTQLPSSAGWLLRRAVFYFRKGLHSSEAAEKLRKSFIKAGGYWHLRKSWLLRRAAEKPAFTKLLRNSAEKLQKSRLFYSFYEAFTQSFVKLVMVIKSCVNTAITQVPVPPAFAKLLHAITQVPIPPAFV